MRNILRSLLIATLALSGATALAQGHTIYVVGHLNPCTPANEGTPVNIQVFGHQSGPVSATTTLNANCYYYLQMQVPDTAGLIFVGASCSNGMFAQDTASYSLTPPFTVDVVVDLNCGSPSNCQACFTIDQTDAFTGTFNSCSTGGTAPFTYLWDFSGPGGGGFPGDGISHTFPGPGTYAACLNVTDANGMTCQVCESVVVDAQGTINPTPSECQACFTIEQASGGGMLTPFVANFTNCSSGSAPFTFIWGMPDGTTSTLPNTSYQFTSEGIHGLCLTIADGQGCTSTVCDTVYVDANGWISTTPPPTSDCMGVINGPDMPGTPCIIPGTALTGTWSNICECVADPIVYDCLQIPNGPNMPGTPCDDNDPSTMLDLWSPDCVCLGLDTTTAGCYAGFFVMQAYQWVDSAGNPNGGGGEPIPNELWLWNLSGGGSGIYQFTWSWGDGTTSTTPFPSHTYPGSGTYTICLTINDIEGCTDTYCQDITVDNDGIYNGFAGGGSRSTFTIHVMNPLTLDVTEQPTFTGLNAWPNPVNDVLNLFLESRMQGVVNISITDLSGRVVTTGTRTITGGRNTVEVPVAELHPGLYLITVGNGTRSVSERFVKVR